MIELTIKEVLAVLSIPTLISSLILYLLKNRFDSVVKKLENREANQEKSQILLIKSVSASLALGEATALAVKNGKCNGETETALSYAQNIKREQKDFLTEIGVKALF